MKISEIKGIGDKLEKVFHKAGVDSVDDLLKYYPRNYDIYEEPVCINELENDRVMAVQAEVAKNLEIKKVRNLVIVNAYLRDANGMLIKATWFHAAYLKNTLKLGSVFVFRGIIGTKNGAFVLEQPKIFTRKQYEEKLHTMQPIYPLVSGLTNNIVIKSVKQALEVQKTERDYLPESIKSKYGLCDASYAIQQIHFPNQKSDMMIARKRLVFDEFFAFMYTLRKYKEDKGICENFHRLEASAEIDTLIANLPYQLTNAQMQTWNEIKKDFVSPQAMNRLIQGMLVPVKRL